VRSAYGGSFAGPLCLPRPGAVQCLGEGVLGPLLEPSYRLYNCRRCAVQVRICARCDRGNIYCAGECSLICRREGLRRAGARYQRTLRGSRLHAARQRRWRDRAQQKVTHQGCQSATLACSVSEHPINAEESTDAQREDPVTASDPRLEPHGRCAFCGAPLSAWTRLRRWAWSG